MPVPVDLWFHGAIDRNQAEDILQSDGDFLVRTHGSNEERYVISVKWKGRVHHVLTYTQPDGVCLTLKATDKVFPDMTALIKHYTGSRLPNCDYHLQHPINRQRSVVPSTSDFIYPNRPISIGQTRPKHQFASVRASKSRSRSMHDRLRSQRSSRGPSSRGSASRSRLATASLVEDQTWFHGLLTRKDVTPMLQRQGDFLVRITEIDDRRRYVISVFWNNQDHHVVLHPSIYEPGKICIDPKSTNPAERFSSVIALVDYYWRRGHQVPRFDYVLMQPVVRKPWELRHENIMLQSLLGRGAFGEVWQGVLTRQDGTITKVAVKCSHPEVVLSKQQIEELCAESRLMQKLRHPNVVKVYGVACEKQPVMIVMELVHGGSLLTWLHQHGKKTSFVKKVHLCSDAAAGLSYCHKRGTLHCDVAARNCLIDQNGVVKVADFGLACEGNKYEAGQHKRLPIRWIAPETLRQGTYTTMTDVWSFGILIWEVMHNGDEPYPDMKTQQVASEVKDGYTMHLSKTSFPSAALRSLTQACWQQDPKARPPMCDIHKQLKDIYDKAQHQKANGH